MSLTPAADDPNRKEELARKKQNPDAFGTSVAPASTPHNEAPNGGLKAVPITQDDAPQDDAPQDDAPQDDAPASWTEFLDQSVDAITAQLNDLSDEQLVDMSSAEATGKNRKTLLSAIADQLEVRAL